MIDGLSTIMGTPPASRNAQLLIHVCQYMKIGKWYDWEDVVKAVTPRAQRMPAAQRAEEERDRLAVKRTGRKAPKRAITDRIVAAGARTHIRWAVDSVVNTFERRGKRPNQQIRLLRVPPHIRPYLDGDREGTE